MFEIMHPSTSMVSRLASSFNKKREESMNNIKVTFTNPSSTVDKLRPIDDTFMSMLRLTMVQTWQNI